MTDAGILAGLRIVEGSAFVAAPLGGMTLAQLGAEVIAVTVDEPILEWTPSWDDRNWRRDAVRELQSWTAPIAASAIDCSFWPRQVGRSS